MRFGKIMVMVSVCALLSCGAVAQAGYIDNGNGTVTDTGTGLMWQQATAPGKHTWKTALAYCERLTLADYKDWRLPTVKELAALVDTSRVGPAINTTSFPGTPQSQYYWSSTPTPLRVGLLERPFYVDFYDGTVSSYYTDNNRFCVRAVRTVQPGVLADVTLWPVPDTGLEACYSSWRSITCPRPWQAFYGQDASCSINTPAYTKLSDNCTPLADNATTWAMVRDAVTGLVWEEKHAQDGMPDYANPNDADNTYTWYDNTTGSNGGNEGTPGDGTDIMDFIRALNTAGYGGYSDWRMPTVKELQSIVAYGEPSETKPSINTTYFPGTVGGIYLSSTTSAGDPASAWGVFFDDGSLGNNQFKSGKAYVRAVRSGQCESFGDLLIYKSGTGAGTVASADGKISCGSDCTEAYAHGAEVTLTAAAAAGSAFAGWSGGDCSGTGTCTVVMNKKQRVGAKFSRRLCPAEKALGENNPALENLRALRDGKLAQSAIGCKVIQIYYNNADSINAALDSSFALRAVAARVLEAVAPLVGEH